MSTLSFIIKKGYILMMAVAVLALVSCGGNNSEDETSDADSLKKDTASNQLAANTFYKIPPPSELYIFLREFGAKFNKDFTNSIDNVSKYNTTDKKALNFGIYASDLAYCSMFGQNQQTLDRYAVTKKMADELGLMEGFDEKIADRIDKNINNNDSLYAITSEAYWTAFNYVEKSNKTNILPYIIVGSWIESVYIAINSVTKFHPDNEIVARIADQGFLLENILGLIAANKDRANFKSIEASLTELQAMYEEVYSNEDIRITKQQYDKITNKIKELRNEFIK